MKCIILAAGYATRLYPLTENFPKPLLKVGDRTIVDHLISDVARSGKIDEYVIVTNHRFAPHFSWWADGEASGVYCPDDSWPRRCSDIASERITVLDDGTSTNDTRLGAVKDILFAIDKLHIDDELLVLAGDNLLDFGLCRFLDYALSSQTSCIMRYYEDSVERLRKCGVIDIDKHDRVISMEEKPQVPRSKWCCPPFYYYTRSDARLVRQGLLSGCGSDAPGSYVAWLCLQVPVHAMLMPGHRYDIGNLESYKKVCDEYQGIAE